jgi:hypothetical protein
MEQIYYSVELIKNFIVSNIFEYIKEHPFLSYVYLCIAILMKHIISNLLPNKKDNSKTNIIKTIVIPKVISSFKKATFLRRVIGLVIGVLLFIILIITIPILPLINKLFLSIIKKSGVPIGASGLFGGTQDVESLKKMAGSLANFDIEDDELFEELEDDDLENTNE